MKVLLVTTQFLPDLGGVPNLLWKLVVHRPPELELRILSVCQQAPETYLEFDRLAPIPIDRVKPFTRSGSALHEQVHVGGGLTSLRFLWTLARLVRQWKPDVIFCGVGYPTAVLAACAQFLFGIPFAAITHSEDLTVPGTLKRRALGWGLNRAQAIFTLGNFGKQQLQQLGVALRTPILGVSRPPIYEAPPGIDPQPFLETDSPAREARENGGRQNGEFRLLTVARLVWRKGQDTVIRALPRLRQNIPGIRYVVVGSGPDEAQIRALAEQLGVAECVTFTGAVSDEQLVAHYQACDVFVMPTRLSDDQKEVEGFGIVFLEAGAAAKPVLAGRSGGVAGAVEEGVTGFLVDPLNVDEIAARVEQLAADPQLARRMGEAGRERVCREFTAQAFAMKIYRVLAAISLNTIEKR